MALRYPRKPGFGAGEGPSLPASFFFKAESVLMQAQVLVDLGRVKSTAASYAPSFLAPLISAGLPGLEYAIKSVGQAVATTYYAPTGLDTLQNAINRSYGSLADVKSGTLTPEKWLAAAEGLRANIQAFFKAQDLNLSLTANMKQLMADMAKDLANLLKKTGGAAGVGVGLYVLGLAALLFFGRK